MLGFACLLACVCVLAPEDRLVWAVLGDCCLFVWSCVYCLHIDSSSQLRFTQIQIHIRMWISHSQLRSGRAKRAAEALAAAAKRAA